MWLRQDQHLLNSLKLSFNQHYGFKQHLYSRSNLRFVIKALTPDQSDIKAAAGGFSAQVLLVRYCSAL